MTRKMSKRVRVFRECLKLAAIVWVIRLGLGVDSRGSEPIDLGPIHIPPSWTFAAVLVLLVVWVFGQFWPVRSYEVPTKKNKKGEVK